MPRLDQLCNIQYGYAFNADLFTTKSSQGVPLVRIRDVVRGYTETYTPESFSEAYRVHDGDILIGMDGEFNVARWHGGDAALNQRVCKITPRNNIHSQYLFYFLPQALKHIEDQTPFVTVKHLSAKKLSAIEVPDISMMEQANIAERLDIITTLLANRRQVDEKLAELPKARFVEMFGDTETHTDLKSACKIITDGTHQPPPFTKQGIPFLFVTNIINNVIRYDAEKFISQETYDALIKRTPIEIGDLLLSTVGSYGHAAIVETDQKFLFQRHIAYLKPDSEKIDSYYLHAALMSDRVQQTIEARVKGIAQKTLNLSEVKKLEVPLPPLSAQRQFAAFARACAAQRAACARQIAVLETLRGKLLQDAFGAAG